MCHYILLMYDRIRSKIRAERKGAIPFSLISVIILVLSSFAIIYISGVQNRWEIANNNSNISGIQSEYKNMETYVQTLAVNAALSSLKNVSSNGYMWMLNAKTEQNFLEMLYNNIDNNNGYMNSYSITIPGFPDSVSITTSTVPFNYNGTNGLGMAVEMRTPVAVRIAGSVPIDIVNPQTGAKLEAAVSINEVVPSTISFLMSSSNLVKYDFSSVGIGMKIVHLILQAEAENGVILTASKVNNALQFALYLVEAMVYRITSDSKMNALLSNMPQNELLHMNPVALYNEMYGTSYVINSYYSLNPTIYLDLGNYGTSFVFDGSWDSIANMIRSYAVTTTINNSVTISIDRYQYSPPFTLKPGYWNGFIQGANVYDININNFNFSIMAKEAYTNNPSTYTTLYNVNTMTRVYNFVSSTSTISPPSMHNPYWFVTQFAAILDPSSIINISVYNQSGYNAYAFTPGTLISVNLNGMSMGLFSPFNAITLNNVGVGDNQVAVTIKYPNGMMEYGNVTVNVESSSRYNVRINTTSEINTQELDTIEMTYLKDTPHQLWIPKLSQLFASLVGYPYPSNSSNFQFNNSTTSQQVDSAFNAYLTWATGFISYISANQLSLSFENNFEGYSLIEGIVSSLEMWKQIVSTLITVNEQYGVKATLQQLNYTMENIATYYPTAAGMDMPFSFMEGFAAPSGFIVAFMNMMNVVPAYVSMYQKMYNYITSASSTLINLYDSLPSTMAFTFIWIINYPTENLSQIEFSITHNVQIWKGLSINVTKDLNSIGVPDTIIGMEAWLLVYYAYDQFNPISNSLEIIMPGNANFYNGEISKIVNELNNMGGMDQLTTFTGILIVKQMAAENLSWSKYVNNLVPYSSNINNVSYKLQLNGIVATSLIAAVVLYKFVYEQNVSWNSYLNNLEGILSNLNQSLNDLKALKMDNLWEALGAIVIGKFFIGENMSWSQYMSSVTSYLNDITELNNGFASLGINNVVGFGLVILAKYTLASNTSWSNYLNNISGFWMPAILSLNNEFQKLGINNVVGFAAVILGKFILLPNSDWSGYFKWASTHGVSDINTIMSSFKTLGINNIWGFAALVLGKFIVGANQTWAGYLDSASTNLGFIASIKDKLQETGINGFAGLAAVVAGKFVFGANDTWESYLSTINHSLSALLALKKDFKAMGLNSNFGYLGFAAAIAVKYIFLKNESWSNYFKQITKYSVYLMQGITFIKKMVNKYGVGVTLLAGAAAVAAFFTAKEIFAPDESISQFGSQLFKSGSFWFGKVSALYGIFQKYGNMPEVLRLTFQIGNVVTLVDKTALYFIKGGNGVYSILSTSTWQTIHSFIKTYLYLPLQIIQVVEEGISAVTKTITLIQQWSDYHNWGNPVKDVLLILNTVQVISVDITFAMEVVDTVVAIIDTIDAGLITMNTYADEIPVLQEISLIITAIMLYIEGVMIGTALAIEMFQQQLTIDHGSVAETLLNLFTDFFSPRTAFFDVIAGILPVIVPIMLFEEGKIGWGIASIFIMPLIAPLVLLIGLLSMIYNLIFNWNGVMAFLFGSPSDYSPSVNNHQIVKMESSLSDNLQSTLSTVANINSMKPSETFSAAGSTAGEMYALSNIAMFTTNSHLSHSYWNATKWESDQSSAYFRYAITEKSTRWSVMNFWESALDLVSRGYSTSGGGVGTGKVARGFKHTISVTACGLFGCTTDHYTHSYAGNIYVVANKTSKNYTIANNYIQRTLANPNDAIMYPNLNMYGNAPFLMQNTSDVENLLMNMNSTIANALNVHLSIYAPDGKIIDSQSGHGLQTWINELKTAGVDLSSWSNLLSGAKFNLSYVDHFGNATGYSESLGMERIYLEPALRSVNLTITSDSSSTFYYDSNVGSGYAHTRVTLQVFSNKGSSFYIYLTPGTYTFNWSSPVPESNNTKFSLTVPTSKTVTLYPFTSPKFYNPSNNIYINVIFYTTFYLKINDMATPIQYVGYQNIENNTYIFKHKDWVNITYTNPVTGYTTTVLEYEGIFNATGSHYIYTYGKLNNNSIALPVSSYSPYFGNGVPSKSILPYITINTAFLVGNYTYWSWTKSIIWKNKTVVSPYWFINNYYDIPLTLSFLNITINYYMGWYPAEFNTSSNWVYVNANWQ